jgi:arsenite-transporting ATPase
MEVCSVDPAPSLDDIFHVPVTDVPRPVFRDEKFRATEFDASALFRSWIANIRATVDASTSTEMSGIHIDLSYERKLFSELLEIVPPGLDEVLAIFRILEISTANRLVIIDMAPTGHALELLRMPAKILSWSRLLLKSLASHRKLALAREASVKIAELEMRARELSRLFQGAESSVYAVMLPELLPDRETERLVHELRALKLDPSAVFVNRVILPDAAGPCARCRSAAKWQASVLTGLKRRLRTTTVYAVPAFDHELAGKQGLQELTRELWELI